MGVGYMWYIVYLKLWYQGTGEMDGSVVRTFAALQEDPSSVLSIHMGQLIATQLQLQGTQHPLVPSGWRVRAHPPPPRTHARTHAHAHAHHTHTPHSDDES